MAHPRSLTIQAAIVSLPGERLLVLEVLPPDLNAFRPNSFEFTDDDDWVINDFKIGGHSQMNRNDVIATDFHKHLRPRGCDTIQRRMDYEMSATYQGSKNTKFCCVMSGPAVAVAP